MNKYATLKKNIQTEQLVNAKRFIKICVLLIGF